MLPTASFHLKTPSNGGFAVNFSMAGKAKLSHLESSKFRIKIHCKNSLGITISNMGPRARAEKASKKIGLRRARADPNFLDIRGGVDRVHMKLMSHNRMR